MCKVTAGDVKGGHGGGYGEHDGGNAGSEGHAGEPVIRPPAQHRLLPPNSATDLPLLLRTAPPTSSTNQPTIHPKPLATIKYAPYTKPAREDEIVIRARLRRCEAANDGGLAPSVSP